MRCWIDPLVLGWGNNEQRHSIRSCTKEQVEMLADIEKCKISILWNHLAAEFSHQGGAGHWQQGMGVAGCPYVCNSLLPPQPPTPPTVSPQPVKAAQRRSKHSRALAIKSNSNLCTRISEAVAYAALKTSLFSFLFRRNPHRDFLRSGDTSWDHSHLFPSVSSIAYRVARNIIRIIYKI